MALFFLFITINPFAMDRRSFLRSTRKQERSGENSFWNYSPELEQVSSGLAPMKGKLSSVQLTHLLKRTMFGAKADDLDHFRNQKLKAIVEELVFSKPALPAPPVNNYNDPESKKNEENYFVDEDIPAGETWVNATTNNGKNNGRRRNSFKSWWYGLMVNQDRSLREKMVLFWHNHFATEANIVGNALFIYRHNNLLREHALGNFRTLVKQVTLDPAMLKYLNGSANTKKAPDENYGRELQELFTVGKGPDSHYTENDVKAAARVLTGYKIEARKVSSVFDPSRHDQGDKQFSSFYGNRVIKGRKGAEGAEEMDELVDMILEQEEVSRFICRKLYRFFVYHTIDKTTEDKIIAPLARLFREKDYEVKPVLQALLGSKHFFDSANFGAMIKSPVDFTVGLCREFNVQFPDPDNFVNCYGLWEQLRNQTAGMQQNIGDPPNVAGWQAYYQEPQFDKLWISSDTLPRRNVFTDRMINFGLLRNESKLSIDPVSFTKSFSDPADPDKLISEAVQRLYNMDLPATDKTFIKSSILLSGLTGMQSDHYWTDSWTTYINNPEERKNADQVLKKLKALYKYLMNRPEYQLC